MSEQTSQSPESPENPTDSFAPVVASDAGAPAAEHKSSKVNTVLAWVGILAGSVFIVATIFFSGFFLGAHAGGHHHGWHKQHHGKDSSQFRSDERGAGWHHGPGMRHRMGPDGRPGGPGGPGDGGPGGAGGPGAPGVPPAPPAQPGR